MSNGHLVKALLLQWSLLIAGIAYGQVIVREHLLMDFGWRFAFGHPYDPAKDFNNGTGYFSYFAKAGYGDGAAAKDFDDMHRLITTVSENGVLIDRCETIFGIRCIRFDPNEGFFLNGQRLEIKGTNNHQDHAGVGTAIPDALQTFRIASLKSIGCNAYRCSHHPPTPELLDACDRLGMLVIDKNRLMGTASTQLDDFKKLILRDRNHPSVISWSIGNEEWGIENNIVGARIAATMQAFTKSLDSTRAITAAFSGGWGQGLSAVMDLIHYTSFRLLAYSEGDMPNCLWKSRAKLV